MYAYTCMCMYVCMCIYIYINVYTYIKYTHICICMLSRHEYYCDAVEYLSYWTLLLCFIICVYMISHTTWTWTCRHVRAHTHIFIYIYIYIYIYVFAENAGSAAAAVTECKCDRKKPKSRDRSTQKTPMKAKDLCATKSEEGLVDTVGPAKVVGARKGLCRRR